MWKASSRRRGTNPLHGMPYVLVFNTSTAALSKFLKLSARAAAASSRLW